MASVIFSILFLVTIYSLHCGGADGQLALRPHRGGFFTWTPATALGLAVAALLILRALLPSAAGSPHGCALGKPWPPSFAAAALVAASILFSWFIGMSSKYSLVYGSLASVIILLLWLYLCGNILILGNVFNCVWYKRKKIRYLKKLKKNCPPEQLGG